MSYNISTSKPTQDQLKIISCIEDVLRIKFLGETEEDAKKFILVDEISKWSRSK